MSDSVASGSTSRAEHLAWCKQRALEYVDDGDLTSAFASMVSDLGKHEGTAPLVEICVLGVPDVASGDPRRVRRFIEGFN